MAAENSLAFKEWVTNEGLTLYAEVAELEGTQLGIDAEDYLNTLLTNTQTREPLLPALGGLPFALRQHIDTDLEHLRTAKIRPTFVFNGLEIGCRDRKSISKESQKSVSILDDAWRIYDLGRGDDAVAKFGMACAYRTDHIVRYLMFYLHQKGVHVTVAPFSAAAQLHYYYMAGYTVGTVGSVSTLVFGSDRVITHFNWEIKRFPFVTTESILTKLSLNESQLVDLCLLSGSSILTTMPEVDADTTHPNKIAATRAVLARAGNDGHAACLRANDEEYLALFRKAKAASKHMVIVYESGEIKQMDFENAPSDTHEFVSQRLPEELIAYQMHGLVSPRVLNWRTRQEIFELPPLDGGSSQIYKQIVSDKLQPIRKRSLAVLTRSLHRYFSKQEVNLICWFSENDKRAVGVKDINFSEITKDAETWHVKESLMNQSTLVKKINLNQTPIQYTITLLSDDALAKKTVTRRKDGEHTILTKSSEMLSNIMWRFLQDRGYINSDHTLSAWGKALKAAFDRAIKDGLLGKTTPENEAEEAIFTAFELLRLDVLNNKQLFQNPPFTGPPMRGSDADKANVLLISRIACLGTFQHGAIGYTGPLSRHLLAFHQVTAAVRSSLRDLAEIHGANMMLGASAARLRDSHEYTDVGARLPFGKEPDLGLALVVKSHLDELSQEPSRRADITKWFNHALNIEQDLKKAWKMWDAINTGIQAADSAIVSSEVKAQFESTDTWLEQRRNVPNANGTKINGTA